MCLWLLCQRRPNFRPSLTQRYRGAMVTGTRATSRLAGLGISVSALPPFPFH